MGELDLGRAGRPLRSPALHGRDFRFEVFLMAEAKYETHEYDVVVIGAGGAGLRAAVEASAQGVKTALVCKSLLGKAHTVMAEGGIAAAMGNVYPEDNWKVHFRDTMRGGKLLNNWRMAQIHAQEAPDRVLELEEWGALFDRTKDGLILQRDFGGHRYARLAHVGDRTGLEMIRTLQNHAVHRGIDVFMECTLYRLLTEDGAVSGAFGYWRGSGKLAPVRAQALVVAHRRGWEAAQNNSESLAENRGRERDAARARTAACSSTSRRAGHRITSSGASPRCTTSSWSSRTSTSRRRRWRSDRRFTTSWAAFASTRTRLSRPFPASSPRARSRPGCTART